MFTSKINNVLQKLNHIGIEIWGNIIGMTNMQEIKLAKDTQITYVFMYLCNYAMLILVTVLAAGTLMTMCLSLSFTLLTDNEFSLKSVAQNTQ